MKKFTRQLFIFIVPVIIFINIPTYILYQSKENFNKVEKLIRGNEKYLIGYAYHEENYRYLKWAYLNLNKKKEIWALGSSRALQFRASMFDSSFYNAGYTISSINDFRPFLKSIPLSKYPNYIILCFDQWMFNSSFDNLNTTQSSEYWQNGFSFFPKYSITYPAITKDLFLGKYSFIGMQHNDEIDRVGLNATVNNKGFRNDGSMFYGDQILKLMKKDTSANDYNYSNTLKRIAEGTWPLEYGSSVNPMAIHELNEILKFCKENKIEVVGFLPPFADRVYNKMIESNKYNYLKEVFTMAKPVFEKYKFEFYNFSTISLCNSNDNETIDGLHGGEVTYQRMLINMLDAKSILNEITNKEKIQNDLVNRKSNYIIYDY